MPRRHRLDRDHGSPRTVFQNADVRFVNIHVAPIDTVKHAGVGVVADAREALESLTRNLAGHQVPAEYVEEHADLDRVWQSTVGAAYHPGSHDDLLTQREVVGQC